MSVGPLSRRSVLRGAVMAVVAAVVGFVVARTSQAAKPKGPGTAANGYGASAGGGSGTGRELTPLDRVPSGGGVVVASADVVVVRDQQGDVRAFSATCTHQGCTVTSVSGGAIHCP